MAAHERMAGWPAGLQLRVSQYVQDHGLDPQHFLPVDLVLILLRIGDREALERAEELAGRPITVCPSGMPPWPPKPVVRPAAGPKVSRVLLPNPCANSEMRGRYDQVKAGMTREQLLARGVTPRDIRYWIGKEYIAFT